MSEEGEATVRVHLIDGKIIVKNAKGVLLLEGEAEDGFWNSLWECLHTGVDVTYRATAKDFA